jgi:hypothetical protein
MGIGNLDSSFEDGRYSVFPVRPFVTKFKPIFPFQLYFWVENKSMQQNKFLQKFKQNLNPFSSFS